MTKPLEVFDHERVERSPRPPSVNCETRRSEREPRRRAVRHLTSDAGADDLSPVLGEGQLA